MISKWSFRFNHDSGLKVGLKGFTASWGISHSQGPRTSVLVQQRVGDVILSKRTEFEKKAS